MKKRKKPSRKTKPRVWEFRLYVADTSANSVLATSNLQHFCEAHLQGKYRLTVIDLTQQPELAREAEVIAVPTLVRVLPGPPKAIIGTLSDTDIVLKLLGLNDQPEHLASALSAAGVSVGSA